MEKGESLKDTVQTLSAYDPAAIVIRSPHAGRRRRWWRAGRARRSINAGDGKHEHPTQALLDLYTLKRRVGSLEGLERLDRRRRAPQPRRALEHPGLHAHGLRGHGLRAADADPARHRVARLRGALHARRARRGRRRLRAADAARAHERARFVPSLREYAARYQIDGRRLGPNQLLMHPGPVNRGVELSAEVIDSPQALITEQVESGVVVRMAVLYELLAGRGAPGGARAALEPEPQPA